MLEILVVRLVAIVGVGISIGIIPYVMRSNIHFGVIFPDEAKELATIKKWKKSFFVGSNLLILISILSLFVGMLLNLDDEALTGYINTTGTVMIAVMVTLQFCMYAYFYRQAKLLKNEKFSNKEIRADVRIMISTNFRSEKIIISNGWFLALGGIIILTTALTPILLYEQVPPYISMIWNYDSNQVSLIPKSPHVFAIIPIIQLGMLLIFIVINRVLQATKQIIEPRNANLSVKQNRAYRHAMSKTILISAILMLILLAIPQFLMMFVVPDNAVLAWLTTVLSVIIFSVFIYVILKYGQGGERYKYSNEANNKHQMLDDTKLWKWGMFYYNPDDPTVFTEKRFGVGTTMNFARWQSWACLAGTLVIVGAITAIVRVLES